MRISVERTKRRLNGHRLSLKMLHERLYLNIEQIMSLDIVAILWASGRRIELISQINQCFNKQAIHQVVQQKIPSK